MRTKAIKRTVYFVAAAFGLCVLAWADHQGCLLYQGGDFQRYEGQSFTVARVVDGDTIDIAAADGSSPTTRIRLWGIDTPEKADWDTDRPAEPFAEAASALTQQLCAGEIVQLHLQRHRLRGDFGRLLAYVTLPDGTMLNERLLAAGLARAVVRADPRFEHELKQRFTMIERQARHDRIGMWADSGP